jgi:adenylate cyclase class 2
MSNIEYEAKFLNIVPDEMRERLKRVGATLVYPERLFRRVVFTPPLADRIAGSWLRVRDEGDKITMSLKVVAGGKIDDQEEYCLEIDNFDEGIKFLEKIGAQKKAYQETKREKWLFQNVEITIDTWPGLNPFIEIEGASEELVKKTSVDLGFNYEEASFGGVDIVYERVLNIAPDVINNHTPEMTFENPPQKNN